MIIYWASHFYNEVDVGFKIQKPKSVKIDLNLFTDNVLDGNDKNVIYSKCPAHRDYLKNLYGISIPFDYDLNFIKDNDREYISSNHYNQYFFDNYCKVRDIKKKLISFNNFYFFLPESNDLMLTQLPAHFEANNFSKKTILITGTFNIGKWPRGLDCAFHMLENFSLKEGDNLYYIKFHTDEKIIFKRFSMSSKFYELKSFMSNTTNFGNFGKNSLLYYYNLLQPYKKYKKLLIEEAKKKLT